MAPPHDLGVAAVTTGRAPAVAGASGCYTIKATVIVSQTGPTSFSGVITGDLEGTVESEVLGFTWPPTGVTNTSTFRFHWSISGGTVPALIGQTFTTHSENRNLLYFLVSPEKTMVRNVGSHRAVAGVSKANLTYVAQTSLESGETRFDHHGVICL
jgi:hypothetical protein